MRVEVKKMNKELIRRNYDFDIRAQKDEKRGNIIIGIKDTSCKIKKKYKKFNNAVIC